jgi:hypothetical protein
MRQPAVLELSLRGRARRATSCVCIGCDGFGRLRESALRRVLLTIRGHVNRGRGRRHRREAAAPDPVNGRREPTGPGRKLPGRATRAGCSGSVPRTPCPCGLSAVHAPVGQQTDLQPRWDERAPSRPTYQRPSSLPQSPRGFASSSSRSFRRRHLHSPLYPIGGATTTQRPSHGRRPVGCRCGWRTLPARPATTRRGRFARQARRIASVLAVRARLSCGGLPVSPDCECLADRA